MVKTTALRRWLRLLIGQVLVFTALYFMGRYLLRNWQLITPALRGIRPGYVIASIVPTTIVLALMPVGWWLALRWVGYRFLDRRGAFRIYYRSSIFRYLPGSVWYLPTRGYLCQQRGIPVSVFVASTVIELGTLLVVGGALAGLAVSARLASRWGLLVSLACLACMGLALLWPDRLRGLITRRQEMTDGQIGMSLALVFVYLGVWLAYGASMALLIQGLGASKALTGADLAYTTGATAAAWLAGFLSLVPAGIGVREAALVGLFQPVAVPAAVMLISLTQRTLELLVEGSFWLIATVTRDRQ